MVLVGTSFSKYVAIGMALLCNYTLYRNFKNEYLKRRLVMFNIVGLIMIPLSFHLTKPVTWKIYDHCDDENKKTGEIIIQG
jgi:hypothetical protein